MGGYVQKPNEGGLFADKKKQTEDDRDYNGSVLVQCPQCKHEADYWLSGYKKVSARSGNTWVKLVLDLKKAQDDIPF